MKALLIAEKPSLMRTIQQVYNIHRNELDFEIDFMAQAGHILGLKMPDEINPEYKKWALENLPLKADFRYKILPGKQKMVKDIKDVILSGRYDFIIHAGDPDQEGEILIRETLDFVGNRLPVKRFWSNDLTEGAILHALQNLREDKMQDNLAAAGYIRQHADYIYGLNLTECMTLKSGTLIRMGRVKAPIIKAIVDREREIEAFVPSSTYRRAFRYRENNMEYVFCDASETFDTTEELLKTMKNGIPTEAVVLSCKTEEKRLKAPKLYKLSTLQTDAYSKLHISGSTTLSVLQNLYEKQLVSYPRSGCEYISSATDVLGIYNQVKGYVPTIAAHQLASRSAESIRADKAYCNDKAIATEGHTGIIPTGKIPHGLSDMEMKLYQLIVRRFCAICVPAKQIKNYTITAKDKNDYQYICKGVKDIDPSFEYILNPNYQPKQFDFAPEKGKVLTPIAFEPKEIEKKCPVRFNEGSFIKFLSNPKDYKDEEGHVVKYQIGTDATRAPIIKECINCNYFTSEKGVFVPTEFAKTIVKDYGDLSAFQIDNSAQWEYDLNLVRTGEADAAETETYFFDDLVQMITDLKPRMVTKLAYNTSKTGTVAGKTENTGICKCPCCETGEIRENSKAFGCSNWNAEEKCGFTLWKNCFGATLTKTDAKKLISGKTIEKTLTSQAGKKYKKELAYDFDAGKVVWAENLRQRPEIELA